MEIRSEAGVSEGVLRDSRECRRVVVRLQVMKSQMAGWFQLGFVWELIRRQERIRKRLSLEISDMLFFTLS